VSIIVQSFLKLPTIRMVRYTLQ